MAQKWTKAEVLQPDVLSRTHAVFLVSLSNPDICTSLTMSSIRTATDVLGVRRIFVRHPDICQFLGRKLTV